MAKITAEFLKQKNIPDDVANEILSSIGSDYTENTSIKDKYVEKSTHDTEVKGLNDKISNYSKAVKGIQKLVGAEDETGIADAISNLQTTIKENDKAHKAEMQKLQRDGVDERLLSQFNAINGKAVKPFLQDVDASADITTYEQMRKTQIEGLVAGEDTKFLFKAQDGKLQIKGAEPGNGADNPTGGDVDISTMTYDQLCAHMAANPDATLQ